MTAFISPSVLSAITWQGLERLVTRLLLLQGYDGVRLVGQSRDGGADVIGHRGGKRWLFQVKRWNQRVGADVVDYTLQALQKYRSQVPVVVALGGFQDSVSDQRQVLLSEGIPLQLWDSARLISLANRLPPQALVESEPDRFSPREYQEDAIDALVRAATDGQRRAFIVLATGLGKTFVAAEAIRRLHRLGRVSRVLVLAHTNELVYQLERAFWPFLLPDQATAVWNGYERLTDDTLSQCPFVFACVNSVAEGVARGAELPAFDAMIIDECHHVGGAMYSAILNATNAGTDGGPFLLGLTATPWRPDDVDLEAVFGVPLVTVDLVTALKRGFLANVDYRMYTDNVRWDRLDELGKSGLSPRNINRTLFISEWDDAVVYELQHAWTEQTDPRALIFCGTIDHAQRMRDRINSLDFCRAEAVYSQATGQPAQTPWDRGRILADFYDGSVRAVCVVDVFNEGIDVPDVNIIVFQRVTHSRRIFVQQLGRGLRLSAGKEHVIVLDFVSDIRRFAAGLSLQRGLATEDPGVGDTQRIRLGSRVTFKRVGGADERSESFLREWLEDVGQIEAADEDASVLQFPPPFPSSTV